MDDFLEQKLSKRAQDGSLRKLSLPLGVDFCSNDYLGFARSATLAELVQAEADKHLSLLGATGSRLLAGNSAYVEALEANIAKFHQAEAGLIFNSGYDANVGILSSIPQRGDTLVLDELIHASLIDGARLSYANRFTFKHNDLNSLEDKLKRANGRIFIVVESVYSMDGDEAPLKELAQMADAYKAHLIVDEAHAVGVIGAHGKGKVQELGLEDNIFLRVVTFGKALGSHGAIVLGTHTLRNYLINFARSFIYTTSLPFHNLYCIKGAYDFLQQNPSLVKTLHENIHLFKTQVAKSYFHLIDSKTAIQSIVIGGNERTKQIARHLQNNSLDVKAILSPTVAEGSERLRICLHSFNSTDEINKLSECLASSEN